MAAFSSKRKNPRGKPGAFAGKFAAVCSDQRHSIPGACLRNRSVGCYNGSPGLAPGIAPVGRYKNEKHIRHSIPGACLRDRLVGCYYGRSVATNGKIPGASPGHLAMRRTPGFTTIAVS